MHKLTFLGLGLAGAVAVIFACGTPEPQYIDVEDDSGGKDGGKQDGTHSPESGLGELRFQPEQTYSGFDGQHTFKVPIAVYDSDSDLAVTAPTADADVTPVKLKNPVNQDGLTDNGKYFMVTVRKAGTITLTAKSGGKTVTSKITVASYPAARWTTGKARYDNGGANTTENPPCTNCHGGGTGIDHSPAAMASATDDGLGTVITQGISTANFPIMIDNQPGHKWDVTDSEREGLITYLRGLEPRGFE